MRTSTPLRVLVSALALILVITGVSACGDAAADDQETAEALVAKWTAAWNSNDREALAAIFTADATAVYTGVHSATITGREEIARLARVEPVQNLQMGEVTVTEDGRFTCSGTYEGGGYTFLSELTFELDGDLISNLAHHDEVTE